MMTHRQPRPTWWLLYALVPVMGGLLPVESRASLSPGGHKAVQIGIILSVYGLVWVWIWANDVALLYDDRQVISQLDERYAPEMDDGATSWVLDPGFMGFQTYDSVVRLHTTGRRTNITSNGREIRKCSLSLDRQSRRWRS
jgi:hypothetical protein